LAQRFFERPDTPLTEAGGAVVDSGRLICSGDWDVADSMVYVMLLLMISN
jgi:hypothetical protein